MRIKHQKSRVGVEGGGVSSVQKPKDFIALLTRPRQGLCLDHVRAIYEPCMSHLPAMYEPCTPKNQRDPLILGLTGRQNRGGALTIMISVVLLF